MAAKRTGLGRGIGALIPTNEQADDRPSDVFFPRAVAVDEAPSPEAAGADGQENLIEVPGARLAQQVADEVREHFPKEVLDTIIPRSVRVSEAPSFGQSVLAYDGQSAGAIAYREAAVEMIRRDSASNERGD